MAYLGKNPRPEFDRGERKTLTVAHPRPTPVKRPAPVTTGHDAILKSIQDISGAVEVITLAGESYEGLLIGRDNYTITIETTHGNNVTIFKHAIEMFTPLVTKAEA